MENGESKEFIYTTHGHIVRGDKCWWEEGAGQKRIKGKKTASNVIT